MKKSVFFKFVMLMVFMPVLFSCNKTSSVDINNEQAVMKDIQGVWYGYQATGKLYRHFKLIIDNNLFKGWVQNSESQAEPTWNNVPDEEGMISLSSILQDSGNNAKYRNFAFTCSNRCCGDKSFSQKTLAKMITYIDGNGLTVDGKVKMNKR